MPKLRTQSSFITHLEPKSKLNPPEHTIVNKKWSTYEKVEMTFFILGISYFLVGVWVSY